MDVMPNHMPSSSFILLNALSQEWSSSEELEMGHNEQYEDNTSLPHAFMNS